jgi:hypothetical protein
MVGLLQRDHAPAPLTPTERPNVSLRNYKSLIILAMIGDSIAESLIDDKGVDDEPVHDNEAQHRKGSNKRRCDTTMKNDGTIVAEGECVSMVMRTWKQIT